MTTILQQIKESELEDVFKHLFSNKYSEEEKKEVLAYCEKKGLLDKYVKEYQSKYYLPIKKSVQKFTLAKDLGFI